MSHCAPIWFMRPCQGGITVFRGSPAITEEILFYACKCKSDITLYSQLYLVPYVFILIFNFAGM